MVDTRVSSTTAIGLRFFDPWPGYWSNDWYDTDDVYVVYQNDGYYLYDDRYPGIGIAISISM